MLRRRFVDISNTVTGSHSALKKIGVRLTYTLLVCLIIITQPIAITNSIFNFSNVLKTNSITFDLTEMGKINIDCWQEICCASNVTITNVKILQEKN